jgi:hypothetical protein
LLLLNVCGGCLEGIWRSWFDDERFPLELDTGAASDGALAVTEGNRLAFGEIRGHV